MTLDKFGRHIHDHHSNTYKLCLVEDISALNYYTMFYIMAVSSDEHGYYRIINSENLEYTYSLPSATIVSLRCSPTGVRIYINNEHADTQSLIGKTLKSGDKISAQYRKNTKTILAFEALLKIPLIQPTQV